MRDPDVIDVTSVIEKLLNLCDCIARSRTGVHIVGLIMLLIREHAAQLIASTERYAMIAASSVRWQTEGPKCHAPSPIRSTLRPRRHAAPRECRYHRQFDVAADIGI